MHEKRRSLVCTKGNRKCKTRSSARRRDSCTPNTCSEANNDRPKEQDEMEVESDLPSHDNTVGDRKFKKTKRKGTSTNSLVATLIANNRALAAAHERVEQELHEVQLQNVQLNKQFLASHEGFVEKTNDLEQQVQTLKKMVAGDTDKGAIVVWQNIYNVLQEACTQFLRGSNLLSDALHLVNSILNPVDGHVTVSIQNHASPHVTFNNVSSHMIIDHMRNSVCTTPPPDEPSAMELTATHSVVIEATDHKQIGVENDHGHVNCNDEQGSTFQIGQENVSCSMESIAEAMEMDKVKAVNGRKRRRCVGICYTEPCLNSKLRRGDPFTDSSMYTDRPSPKRGKKKKNSRESITLSLKKKRVPLTNLTNVISEEN